MSLYALARVSKALFAVSVIFPIVGGLIAAGIWMVLVDPDDA